jgi:hypothetical protein
MKTKIKKREYRLISIDYKAIDSKEESFSLEIKTSDSFRLVSITQDLVELTILRNVCFDPNLFYDLKVEMGIRLNLVEDEGGTEIDESFVKKNIEKLVEETHVFEWLTLIIAQISSSLGFMPIITPNHFIVHSQKRKKEKKSV